MMPYRIELCIPLDYLGKTQRTWSIQIKTRAVLLIAQIAAAVSTDSPGCQFYKPGQWSSCIFFFLFSGCSFIVFHKSLLSNCSLLQNFTAAFCIHMHISLENQAHIHECATELRFLNAIVCAWPDYHSPKHLAVQIILAVSGPAQVLAWAASMLVMGAEWGPFSISDIN